jgi:hypothetical protein
MASVRWVSEATSMRMTDRLRGYAMVGEQAREREVRGGDER